MSVSYTHLDVYKRQREYSHSPFKRGSPLCTVTLVIIHTFQVCRPCDFSLIQIRLPKSHQFRRERQEKSLLSLYRLSQAGTGFSSVGEKSFAAMDKVAGLTRDT